MNKRSPMKRSPIQRSMMWATAFLVCLPLLAQKPTPEANGNLVVFARSVWTGEALVSNRKIVVRDGKVVEISAAENRDVPSGARVIEVNWVMPGLVLADSMTLTGPTAEPVSVTPGVRALDGYDPFIPRPALLRSGITAVYLSPGRNRLVAGQGAVVRPGLAENDDYMIKSVASLHCSVAAEALNPASVFEPPVAPTEEDEPFRPARRQFPRARGGAFMALRELFARAMGEDAPAVPDSQYNVDLRPLKSLLEGRVPLRVRAETAADIYGALQVARRFKLHLVVEGGTEAWKMAEELGAAAASVILASGTDPTGKLPPPKPFRAPAGRGHAEAAAILKKAGVRVALVPKKDGAFEDLLWYAATARVPGKFSDEDVLRAVTSDAARVLGVDALAGTLRVGGAADIVGFDQHPLQAAADDSYRGGGPHREWHHRRRGRQDHCRGHQCDRASRGTTDGASRSCGGAGLH